MARSKYTDIELRIMNDISNSLKQIMESTGKSQTDLGIEAGLSTSTICDYVNGRTLISPTNLQKIADALGVKCRFMGFELEELKGEI